MPLTEGSDGMARKRHQRVKHQEIAAWPNDKPAPVEVAGRVVYIGSAEHKAYHSPAGHPALRSDATPCNPRYTDLAPITEALREAVLRGCIGVEFIGDFPKYVWGWLDDRLYEARHVGNGGYKGYALEPIEFPRDPEARLIWGADHA
jgi:hypothetical protein